jgi:hypothetical protein
MLQVYIEMVECGLCIYIFKIFCEMSLLPLNMKYILMDFNPMGQFYDTVCIVQLMIGVRLFSGYLLNCIVVTRDYFRIKF